MMWQILANFRNFKIFLMQNVPYKKSQCTKVYPLELYANVSNLASEHENERVDCLCTRLISLLSLNKRFEKRRYGLFMHTLKTLFVCARVCNIAVLC